MVDGEVEYVQFSDDSVLSLFPVRKRALLAVFQAASLPGWSWWSMQTSERALLLERRLSTGESFFTMPLGEKWGLCALQFLRANVRDWTG